MTKKPLKAPFPWFGGKSRVAGLLWPRLGDVRNYIEPFAGSAAMLLLRPHAPAIETINDYDCYVANFWRATSRDPEAVAAAASHPVNECDLHARHKWLVLSPAATDFRLKMRTDPDYFDAKVAGWWCWGLCCWIGGGWCQVSEDRQPELFRQVPVAIAGGVNAKRGPSGGSGERSPKLSGGPGQHGNGIHAKGPPAAHDGDGDNASSGQLPMIGGNGTWGRGVHQKGPLADDANNRPQLGDAFSRGRGVNGHDQAETCADRLAWLTDWFGRLRDRLRTVRVCCGDWLRVCDSESVTTRLGTTGIFLDPPYSTEAGRDMGIYGCDSGDVAHAVRAYCLERGDDPAMRICLAGYAGEGHEELESRGWECTAWKAQGGYGNRSERGKENAAKERLWFSPHCVGREESLFDVLA
jgi:hypothetical protein